MNLIGDRNAAGDLEITDMTAVSHAGTMLVTVRTLGQDTPPWESMRRLAKTAAPRPVKGSAIERRWAYGGCDHATFRLYLGL